MQIRQLNLGTGEFNVFHQVPEVLGLDRNSIPLDLERAQLSPDNPFFQHAEGCGFVCEKEGELSARVFASLDQNLRQPDGQLVGHVGYFAFVGDTASAEALLRAAEEWLKGKGVTHVHGPVNLNIFTGYRVQMSGFDTTPFPGEPRNPEYYGELLEKAGYKVLATWSSWDLPPDFVKSSAEYFKKSASQSPLPGLTIRKGDVSQLSEELQRLYQPTMEIFSSNYGFSQISQDEFLTAFIHLQPLMEADLFHILVDDSGQIGGFVFAYKNAPTDHTRIIFHTAALLEKWRATSAMYELASPLWETAVATGLPVIGALAKEGKTTFDRLGPPSRTYSVVARAL